MQAISIGLTDTESLSEPLRRAREARLLSVHYSKVPELVLEFSSEEPIELSIPGLGLRLSGRPSAT